MIHHGDKNSLLCQEDNPARIQKHTSIVKTVTAGVGVFFGVLFGVLFKAGMKYAKFCPVLSQIHALFGVFSINSKVVYHKLQI